MRRAQFSVLRTLRCIPRTHARKQATPKKEQLLLDCRKQLDHPVGALRIARPSKIEQTQCDTRESNPCLQIVDRAGISLERFY